MAVKRPDIPKSKKVKKFATRSERGTRTGNVGEVSSEQTVAEVFASIDEIRKRVEPLPKGTTVKDLIEEGRR
jgi:hypothetical protein